MTDDEHCKRDHKGQFGSGNQAALKKYRRPRRTTVDLVRLINRKLIELGESRKVDELLAESACKLILAAADGDKKAATWVLERFFPLELERHSLTVALPSPSKLPLEYLDALVRAVAESELTTSQAVRMSQLARPFLIDAELQQLYDEFTDLKEKFEQIDHVRQQEVE